MSRKRLAFILVPLAVIVLLVLALPYLVDVNRYRPQLEAAAGDALGRQVSLGPMQLSLVPLGVRVREASIGEDPAFNTGRPFVRVGELYVSPRLLPLLTGTFELRAVELRQPEIELVRNAAGTWNFSSLGKQSEPSADTTPIVLSRLTVTRGRLGYTDLSAPAAVQGAAARAVYDNIDLEVEDYAPDRAFTMELAATLPGEGAQRLSLQGTAGPVLEDAVADTPFDGSIALDAVSISGAQRFLAAEALDGTDGVISGRADVRNAAGTISSTGTLTLEGARVRGVDIGYPIAAEFDLTHAPATERLTIRKGTLRLGQTPLSLTGTVDIAGETPVLDVHATASNASIAEAARLASAFGVAFGAGTQVQGQVQADVRARGPADRPALEGQVQLRNVSISGADIPQPVRSEAIDLTLTPAEIRSNDFTAVSGSTAVGVRAAVRQYTAPTPSIDAAVRTGDADLGELLNVARAWGVAPEGTTGTGRIRLDLRATGPLDALTLSGAGGLRDASLTTTALTQPLRVPNATLSFSKDAAAIESLTASLGKTTARGRMTVRDFASPRLDFDLSADRIDVAELQGIVAAAPTPATPRAPQEDSFLLKTTGSGRLRVGQITYDQLTLDDVQATVGIDRGLIRLDPLTAGVYGGRHRGVITMDTRRTPTTFAVASQLERVDANQLASSMTSLRDVIFGALGTQARLSFGGDGADAMARSLNGTMSLNLADGRIANMNLTQEISQIARFITGQPAAGERSTRVAGLTGTFQITNGLASTTDLSATIDGGTLGATGTVNLADQALNLRLTAVLARDYSDRVGGTRVGGYMSTVLANQNGELVVPVIVTGTAQNPRFAPDAQRMAEMKVRNLVPGLNDPQGLTNRVLGAITGGEQKEGQAPRNRVGDVIGAITGRGTPPPAESAPPPPPGGAAPPPATPQPKDPRGQVEDVLRGILGGRKPAPKPEEQKAP